MLELLDIRDPDMTHDHAAMRFNVAQLLQAHPGEMRVVDVWGDIELDDPDTATIEPVGGRIHLIRDTSGILVQGNLTTRLSVLCARCLEPVEVPVEVEVEEEFHPTAFIPGGPLPDTSPDRDRANDIDATHILALDEVIRQGLLLAAPMHPLCRPDCAGLCPLCGTNLNTSACDCRAEPDPRWDELRSLLAAGPDDN
jgi:uncharacterized protein